jgi:hypothetical protein
MEGDDTETMARAVRSRNIKIAMVLIGVLALAFCGVAFSVSWLTSNTHLPDKTVAVVLSGPPNALVSIVLSEYVQCKQHALLNWCHHTPTEVCSKTNLVSYIKGDVFAIVMPTGPARLTLFVAGYAGCNNVYTLDVTLNPGDVLNGTDGRILNTTRRRPLNRSGLRLL